MTAHRDLVRFTHSWWMNLDSFRVTAAINDQASTKDVLKIKINCIAYKYVVNLSSRLEEIRIISTAIWNKVHVIPTSSYCIEWFTLLIHKASSFGSKKCTFTTKRKLKYQIHTFIQIYPSYCQHIAQFLQTPNILCQHASSCQHPIPVFNGSIPGREYSIAKSDTIFRFYMCYILCIHKRLNMQSFYCSKYARAILNLGRA